MIVIHFIFFSLFLPIFILFPVSKFVFVFCFLKKYDFLFSMAYNIWRVKARYCYFFFLLYFLCLWFIGVMNTKYHYCWQFRRRNGKSKEKERNEGREKKNGSYRHCWSMAVFVQCLWISMCVCVYFVHVELCKSRNRKKMFHLRDIYGNV